MGNVFTLDSLNDELEKKYAPLEFQAGKEKFVLRQLLRLPKSERDYVSGKLKDLDMENNENLTEDDALEILGLIIKTVTDSGRGDKLLAVLDHDILKINMLFEKWVESVQPGEA